MYNVILIDDEPWTLQGINKTFNWSQFDLEVVGMYTHATQALREILIQKPDVVFTDIRMPVISGIEIISAIRENKLDTEIIIISGFGQFDYAQEAIRQGAFDYCLKPLDDNETDKLLERLKVKLDEKQQEKNKKVVEMIMEEPEEILPESFGLPHKYPYYQAVVWVGDGEEVIRGLLKHLEESNYYEIRMSNKRYYIINSKRDISENILNQEFNHSVGISRVGGASDIPRLISQAAVALADSFISGRKGTYIYRESQPKKLIPLIVRAAKLLEDNQFADYSQLIIQLPALFNENQFTIEDVDFLWNRVIMHLELTYPNRFYQSALENNDWQQLEIKFENLNHLCQTLLSESQYIYGKPDFNEEAESNNDDSNFNKLIKFINQHYNEQIKLKDLSQMYYTNKNYACYLFKRNTGLTFSEYLNKIRMNQAKELLVTTSHTITEISEQVGYTDYFYFNKLFKKTHGITPSQYRKMPIEPVNRLEKTGE